MPKATIITSFYNDRELLPWWLKWHRRLFDHGVLVDWDSTDESVAICRAICPDWTIIKSKHHHFDVYTHCAMLDEAEAGIEGWKGSLNTTEFLFHNDFKGYLERFAAANPDIPAVMTTRIQAVETTEERERVYTPDPLFFQITRGEICPAQPTNEIGEGRVFHRTDNGQYLMGRHGTNLPCVRDPRLYDVKFRWAPHKILVRRIQNFREKMPSPSYHTQSLERWEESCSQILARSHSLLDDPEYKRMYDLCVDEFARPKERS